jgi:hypothetical protein
MSEDKKQSRPGKAIAYDDFGEPITEEDLVSESYRRPLPDSDFLLIPPDDFEGDDDDWDTHLLIESVKKRRKIERDKEKGNV